jgi:hypothetical protein
MALAGILRLAALGSALLFAIIVLGLSADLIATTEKYVGGYYKFTALALAISLLTLLTVAPM